MPKSPKTTHQRMSLFPFVGNPRRTMPQGLLFKISDYVEILDWAGRIIRDDKRGAIQENTPDILTRLNIDTKNWLQSA